MGRMFDALQKVQREKNRELREDSSKVSPENMVLDDKLVSFFATSSLAAEQFRRLRNHILRPWLGKSPKTILITSAMAGEGKTMTAINLAIAIATELHSHALIVDCDLRNPSVSRWFGFDGARGLSDYLSGEVALSDLLIRTSVDKLTVLPGGELRDNPVELIGSNKMKSLVDDLRARYEDRFIILDSSPLLATTEPSVLNQMVDCILIVIKAGYTPRETVQQAFKLLDNKKIIGVLLNNVELKTKAMTRRNFGTNSYYSDYRYSKLHPEPGKWEKFAFLIKNLKLFFGKLRFGKKENL